MEFDISKVYTALNADEVKPGSRVIVADDLAALREKVEKNTEQYPFDEINLDKVNPDSNPYRFNVSSISFMLCYLVSEPKEPRRMTNRELARWLAQGNGQLRLSSGDIVTSLIYTKDNSYVPISYVIRGWDEAKWHEPIVQED